MYFQFQFFYKMLKKSTGQKKKYENFFLISEVWWDEKMSK